MAKTLDGLQYKDLTPWAQYEEVEVEFSATADADTQIAHSLQPPTVEHISYIPIRKAQAVDVYHDNSGTRTAWGTGYIILRATVASAKVRLLLTVSHDKADLNV